WERRKSGYPMQHRSPLADMLMRRQPSSGLPDPTSSTTPTWETERRNPHRPFQFRNRSCGRIGNVTSNVASLEHPAKQRFGALVPRLDGRLRCESMFEEYEFAARIEYPTDAGNCLRYPGNCA